MALLDMFQTFLRPELARVDKMLFFEQAISPGRMVAMFYTEHAQLHADGVLVLYDVRMYLAASLKWLTRGDGCSQKNSFRTLLAEQMVLTRRRNLATGSRLPVSSSI